MFSVPESFNYTSLVIMETAATHFLNVGMDPCKDFPGDVPDPWLCPDNKLSVSKANIPSRSSGTSRNSPSLHTVPKLSIDWYLISMVTQVCNRTKRGNRVSLNCHLKERYSNFFTI